MFHHLRIVLTIQEDEGVSTQFRHIQMSGQRGCDISDSLARQSHAGDLLSGGFLSPSLLKNGDIREIKLSLSRNICEDKLTATGSKNG